MLLEYQLDWIIIVDFIYTAKLLASLLFYWTHLILQSVVDDTTDSSRILLWCQLEYNTEKTRLKTLSVSKRTSIKDLVIRNHKIPRGPKYSKGNTKNP